MIVKELLDEAESLAREHAADATTWDARILLADALGRRNPLALDPREDVGSSAAELFRRTWERRLAGTPVQHLLGEWDFYGRAFRVDSRALVPRPETETLLSAALREAPEARSLLDAGTGSGILAVSFLLERPLARATALDVSVGALALARENAARHGVLSRLILLGSDWSDSIGRGRFDLAVSNPPYIAHSEAAALPATVREHDPPGALFAGKDGLSAIRELLGSLPSLLEPGAPFLFEIGAGQAAEVGREIRARKEWIFDRIDPDLNGLPRVAVARRRT